MTLLNNPPIKSTNKKAHIKTYGCQMNVYDSEQIANVLTNMGYTISDNPDECELVMLNTCHIRDKASEKVYSEVGRLTKIKEKKRKKGETFNIGVAGCVAQAEGDLMLKRATGIDLVTGPQAYHQLPELISKMQSGKRIAEVEFRSQTKFEKLKSLVQKTKSPPSAFVTIQEGCDKFCTFCVVPYTRGAEYSRTVNEIKSEVEKRINDGAQEVVLLGQNVNAYHGKNKNGKEATLGELLFELASINGLKRLRYTTSHPRDVDPSLVAAHRDLDIIMPYLHLPVQSGSNKVLKAMNRKHTVETYLDIIDSFRSAQPGLAISSDFIVGFPEETEKDFEQTLELVTKVQFAQAYSFKYSPRPGTVAAMHPHQIDKEIMSSRLVKLQELLGIQQDTFNHQFMGKNVEVLFERKGKKGNQLWGRTPHMQAVHCDCKPELLGKMAQVKITRCSRTALYGDVIEPTI